MERPLIATKLNVPKLRSGLVPRPRLRERLRRGDESRLTLVSAPAGFGKTTLLAEWLGRNPGGVRSVAWLSLDAQDSEPVSFWTYVVTALRTAVPSVGASALELIASSPMPTELVLTTVVNELAAAPQDVWLVLDDYHLVESQEVSDGMTFLLEHLPPHVHIVLITRADPELPLPRWRVRGELVEVRAADLRFTSEEAVTYLKEATGLHLAAEDVAALEERTEGWIAALQLAALSLRGRDDVSGFIAGFAGNDRYIVDYLVEEVLRHQPEPVQRFLLTTAVLDRLTGPLCDAVTGRDDGRETLMALERANLFVVALDDQREWYRYHHLFADVLRARLLAEQPQQVPLVQQGASRWHEHHGQAEEAVRYALAGRDFDRAAHLIELAVPAMRRLRQDVMLSGWLQALPDATVRRSPVLSVFYGSMLLHSGDLDAAAARLDDAERALAAVAHGSPPPWADSDEMRTLPATIAIHRASLAQARGDVAGTTQHARQALDLTSPTDHLARGGAAGFLGLAAWAQGDISDALGFFTQAVAALHAAGNLVDELSSTVPLADMWLAAGRPTKARGVYERALQLAETQAVPAAGARADLHVGLSEIDCEAGQLDAAKEHLEVAAALTDGTSTTASPYRRCLAMGRIAGAEGDPQAAIAFFNEAERHYRRGFFPDVRPIAALRAGVWIAHGNLSLATRWATAHEVSVTDDASYLNEFDLLTVARLLIARDRAHPDTGAIKQATGLLDRLLGAAETSGRAGSLLEIRMLQALAHHAQEHRLQAREALERALTQAPEPDSYVRLFLDEGAPMMQLLADVSHQGAAGDHADRLLSLGTSAPAQPRDWGQRPPLSAESLSDRELQVLRLLGSELTGPQIASELFVSHNTVRTHTKHIFRKLQVTTRRAAVRRAQERGLL